MKRYQWLFLLLIATGFLSSCNSARHTAAYAPQGGFEAKGKAAMYADINESDGLTSTTNIQADTQKITYTAHINLEVKNPDTAAAQISAFTKQSGGYVQSISNEYAVIKVPAKGLTSAIAEIEKLGKVRYKNITASDITAEYYDVVTRLDNLEKARARYLELLSKAQTVEEMLKVEKELERVNGEMEIIKTRLNYMNNSVQYSTITIQLNEKVKPGILGYPFVWAYKGIKWLFVRD
ncbi:MAG TPA: DUF4349 domain-containing protein [Bacteroidia bacterium]|nr:DUF4349 domain-containing protein [Bacteroidia bacterium]